MNSLGSLFQCFTILSVKNFFPNIRSKPCLLQLEAIFSCPITSYRGQETNPHLAASSFQVVIENSKVTPQHPFLQDKHLQLPQKFLTEFCAPDPSPALFSFSGHTPAPQCFSCRKWPKTEPRIWGVASPVSSTEGWSRPWSCWPHHC